jgi:hypothetical protein
MRKLPQIVILAVACLLTAAADAQVTDTGAQGTDAGAPVTPSGTVNFIPKWTGTTTQGNSIMFQATNGNVGVGLTNPSSKLDVNGTAKVRGIFKLPPIGAATATSGFNSNSFDQVGSSFNSNVGVPVNQTFRWQVLPLGNNTTTPSGELSLAYGSGSNVPTPTGLTVLSNGLINFIPGQPFPGTGTVSSVGSGQGILGGPITTSGTLSLDTGFTDGRYGQLFNSNTWTGQQTVNGVFTSTTINGNRAASFVKGSASIPSSVAAIQVENVTTLGEVAFLINGNAGNPFPVLKLLEVTGATGSFLTCQRPDGTEKCAIDNAGAYHAGSDFAEALPARGVRDLYEPGDVLVMANSGAGVEKTGEHYSHRVVGIFSTRPGFLGADKGGITRVDANDVPVAITGIVPTKVSAENGPVRVGDLLVTGSIPGYAMKATDHKRMAGAIVGKALEPMLQGAAVIRVLVTMQ